VSATPSRIRVWGVAQDHSAPHLQLVEHLKHWCRGRRGGVRGIAGLGAARNQQLRMLLAGWPASNATAAGTSSEASERRQGAGARRFRAADGTGAGDDNEQRGTKYGDRTRTARLRSHVIDNARRCRLYVLSRGRVYTDWRRSVSAWLPLRRLAPPTPVHCWKAPLKALFPKIVFLAGGCRIDSETTCLHVDTLVATTYYKVVR
jgi:hypothetical protein